MRRLKAALRGQDGLKLVELNPNATVTLWQADGSPIAGVLVPRSLFTSADPLISGSLRPLRRLIWILKVNWSGTNSESCTVEAHSLNGTRTDESGNIFAVYRQVA